MRLKKRLLGGYTRRVVTLPLLRGGLGDGETFGTAYWGSQLCLTLHGASSLSFIQALGSKSIQRL